jgi:hypothetical protein
MKKGEVVMIYHDPFTRRKPEVGAMETVSWWRVAGAHTEGIVANRKSPPARSG